MKKYDVRGHKDDGTELHEAFGAADEACALGIFLDEHEGEKFVRVAVERQTAQAKATKSTSKRQTATAGLAEGVLPMPRAILRAYREGLA